MPVSEKKFTPEGELVEETHVPTKPVISYSRKVSDDNYGNIEAGIIWPVAVDVNASADVITEAVSSAFLEAKLHVSEQLGIATEINKQTLVASEVKPKTPEVEKARTAIERELGGTTDVTGTENGHPAKKRTISELWVDLKEHPDRWFDNRNDKRNPKAPDFKRKGTGDGLWVDGKGTPAWAVEQYGKVNA